MTTHPMLTPPQIALDHASLTLVFTDLDIRDRLFAYVHQLTASPEHALGLSQGQPLVQLTPLRSNCSYTQISIQGCPELTCLAEWTGRFRGITLEAALLNDLCDGHACSSPSGHASYNTWIRSTWLAEHSVTATWTGRQLVDFPASYSACLAMLCPTMRAVPLATSHPSMVSPHTLTTIGTFLSHQPQIGATL